MPPLSLTHLKYASATLPIVVKSTPGISMSMPPSLIGVPVAFLPVPLPQTDFVADAVPEPTGPAAPAPVVANAVSINSENAADGARNADLDSCRSHQISPPILSCRGLLTLDS